VDRVQGSKAVGEKKEAQLESFDYRGCSSSQDDTARSMKMENALSLFLVEDSEDVSGGWLTAENARRTLNPCSSVSQITGS